MIESFIRISKIFYHIHAPNDTSDEAFCVIFTLANHQTIVGPIHKIRYFPYILELTYTRSSITRFPSLKPI